MFRMDVLPAFERGVNGYHSIVMEGFCNATDVFPFVFLKVFDFSYLPEFSDRYNSVSTQVRRLLFPIQVSRKYVNLFVLTSYMKTGRNEWFNVGACMRESSKRFIPFGR